jgi:hypothetical protein
MLTKKNIIIQIYNLDDSFRFIKYFIFHGNQDILMICFLMYVLIHIILI